MSDDANPAKALYDATLADMAEQLRPQDVIERCSEHPDATHELICATCSLVLTSDERAGMASDCPDGEQHILRCIRCELPATGMLSQARALLEDQSLAELITALRGLHDQSDSFVNLAMGRTPGTLREDSPRAVRNAIATARDLLARFGQVLGQPPSGFVAVDPVGGKG